MKPTCRICFQDDGGPFLQPCACSGSMAHVHAACLREWRRRTQRSICEVCHRPYQIPGQEEIDVWADDHADMWHAFYLSGAALVTASHLLPRRMLERAAPLLVAASVCYAAATEYIARRSGHTYSESFT